jgi:hypothetical protein
MPEGTYTYTGTQTKHIDYAPWVNLIMSSAKEFFKLPETWTIPENWNLETLLSSVEDLIILHGTDIEKWGKLLEQSLLHGFHVLIDLIFAPKLLLRQIVMIGTLQTFIMVVQYFSRTVGKLRRILTTEGRKEEDLVQKLKTGCQTYAQWQATAQLLDEMRGHDKWRKIDKCALYDAAAIRKRIDDTREMLNRGDVFDLMFRLRGGLARDQVNKRFQKKYLRYLLLISSISKHDMQKTAH